jgi:hypothetical protein
MHFLRTATVALAALAATGCATRTPDWAASVNPCCGQDLVAVGIEPPEDRCADIVVDQATAWQLMAALGGGAGTTQWHARFIPGGPACIWKDWPGVSRRDLAMSEPAPPQDEMERWGAAWARREVVRRPEWAAGRDALRWPEGASRELPESWARERGLLGLTRAEIADRVGEPERVIDNESTSGALLVYGSFDIILYDGVCTGWTPRSEDYEEYFAQPDL